MILFAGGEPFDEIIAQEGCLKFNEEFCGKVKFEVIFMKKIYGEVFMGSLKIMFLKKKQTRSSLVKYTFLKTS